MKFKLYLILFASACLAQFGCSTFRDRLLFIEETHIGLIARVSPDETAPVDVDFGYRRSIVTLTPQMNVDVHKSTEDQAKDDNGQIMSVISAFTAKVRWFEATEIHTYFATGDAASRTGNSAAAIKALTTLSGK